MLNNQERAQFDAIVASLEPAPRRPSRALWYGVALVLSMFVVLAGAILPNVAVGVGGFCLALFSAYRLLGELVLTGSASPKK